MPLFHNVVVWVAVLCLVSLHFTTITEELTKVTTSVHRMAYEETGSAVPRAMSEYDQTFLRGDDDDDESNTTAAVKDVAVFYNLFVDPDANDTEVSRVKSLVREQLTLKQPWHKIYVNSIGLQVDAILEGVPDTTLLQHTLEGSEMVTLRSVYDYCRQHPERKVAYLHSKGSYHPRPENEALRQFLTRGVLSKIWSETEASQCSVGSSRFSPTPHPHTSGNMWLAQCSYVKELIPPDAFTERMAQVEHLTNSSNAACVGSRRFAAEHWIHSHPSVKPCDLYTNTDFQWGYSELTSDSGTNHGDFVLQAAPRVSWKATKVGCMNIFGMHLRHRLAEYKFLYGLLPDASWWGWKLWHEEFKDLFNGTIPSVNDTSIRLVPMKHPKW